MPHQCTSTVTPASSVMAASRSMSSRPGAGSSGARAAVDSGWVRRSPVIGAGLFLAVSGLLALGLGAVFRSTAGAIAAATAVLFMTLPFEAFLPGAMQRTVDRWKPVNAGSQIWATVTVPSAHQFSPWAGFTVFTAYAAAPLTAGLVLFRRRDA